MYYFPYLIDNETEAKKKKKVIKNLQMKHFINGRAKKSIVSYHQQNIPSKPFFPLKIHLISLTR